MLVDVDHSNGIQRSGFVVNTVVVGRLERVDWVPDWPSMVAVDRLRKVVDAVGLDTAMPNVYWMQFLLVRVYYVRVHPIQRVFDCYYYWWVMQAHLVQTVADELVAVAQADVALVEADVALDDVAFADDVVVVVGDEYFYGHVNRHSSVPHDHSLEFYFWCHHDV